ncbi:MAG: SIR2 family protein, partial [Verrucomicrobiales bacterium]|nr:SIR2 family protein [Verrucomicrobiales bacterium]
MEKDKLDGITHSNSEELSDFLEEICQSIKNGDTISPFLGSGISAPSGIIMGKDFECFLAHTMRLFFEEGWNIKERGWPEYPNKAEVDKAQRYLCRKYKQILKKSYSQKVRTSSNLVEKVLNKSDSNNRRKVPETDSPLDLFRPLIPRVIRAAECRESESRIEKIRQRLGIPNEPIDPNLSTTSPAYVEETAIRSLQDWTLTLQFFSRFFPVTTEVRGKQHLYYKEDEDLSIIDTFNAHITDGSRPNLIHNMIARLARTLRIQLILSTNFDTLIEQSYRRLQEPLTSIAVSVKGGLPAPSTVRSQPTMIKLHGELCETRADPSISSPPSKHDKEKFFNYLRGDVNMDMTPGYPRSNLLVIGYSASDPRCVQMIQHVLDLDPEFKVFWICHHESDLDHINGIFDSSRLRTIVHPRSDLILWELYQILNLSIPSGGFTFQLSHDIPPEPLTNSEAADGRFNEELENIATEIRKKTKGKFFAVDCPSGINYTFRRGFNDLVAQGYQCIWLEGESLATPRHFLYILLQGISLRIGKFQLEWVSLLPTNFWSEEHWENGLYAHLDSLMTHFRLDPTKWFLFIYERSGAGASSGLQLNYWTEQQYEDMNKILSNLSSLGFRVIYLVFGKLRSSRNLEKSENLAKFIRKAKLPNREVCDIQREVIDETYNDWFRKEYREQLEDYSSRLQKITPIIVPCNSRPIKSPFPKQRFPDKSFESIIERVGSKM